MKNNRKPYLIVGGLNRFELEEKIEVLWEFGYRPHGSLVVTADADPGEYPLSQPVVYSRDRDERIGEELSI